MTEPTTNPATPHPTGCTALINPISGGGRALKVWRPIADALAAADFPVTEELTRSQHHAVAAAEAAALRGDLVVAVGGDGLVRDVAGGVFPHGGRMAIVPAGRGNDLARKLELPADSGALASMIAAGNTRRIDVIEAAGRIVLGNVYVGLDSVATEAINNNRWLPGAVVYRVAPVGTILRWHAPTFTLTTPDWTATAAMHQVVVANSGRYGYGLDIVPPARLDSGLLHVLTIGDVPRRHIVSFINKAKTGRHTEEDQVEVRTTTQITLDADRRIPVHADGDYLCELPVTVTIRPSALELVIP